MDITILIMVRFGSGYILRFIFVVVCSAYRTSLLYCIELLEMVYIYTIWIVGGAHGVYEDT